MLVLATAARAVADPYGGVTVPNSRPDLPPGPSILLTFDDGPHDHNTPLILAELARHQVHAVFFVNGRNLAGTSAQARARRELLRREIAEGHLVGNHTVDHPNMCARGFTEQKIAWEIDHNDELIRSVIGLAPPLFRAPYGGIHCRRVADALAARHIRPIGWDIDSEDWRYRDTSRELTNVERQIREFAHGGRGVAVVLLHDSQRDTAHALPELFSWLDATNMNREKLGLPPITVVDYRYLLPPLPHSPLLLLGGRALGWIRHVKLPAPFAPLIAAIPS